MIAHVILLTRLPKRFTFFDYRIPEGMDGNIGDLINVRFRGRTIRGIIYKISTTSTQKKLEEVLSICAQLYISEKHLRRLSRIAECLGQSLSSLLTYAMPVFSKEKNCKKYTLEKKKITLKEDELQLLQEFGDFIKKHQNATLQCDQESGSALAFLLAKHQKKDNQLLLLVPRDRDAHALFQIIGNEHAEIVTGATPSHQRLESFLRWKKGELHVLIGTKQVALWEAPNLSKICILQAGNDEYANLRRNPKFDPREAARLLAQEYAAAYISCDTLPRIEDCTQGALFLQETPHPTIISLKNNSEKTPNPLISYTLIESIKNASQNQKKVLLFVNRKGTAKRLHCTVCGETPLCGTCGNLPTIRINDLLCDRCGTEMWIPKACPRCGEEKLKFVGIGGAKIAADLQTHFPHLRIQAIEKGNDSGWQNADILITTEHFFANLAHPFSRNKLGLVADLMADLPVGSVDFRATERTSRQALRLIFLAKRENAMCLFQTWIPQRFPDVLSAKYIIEEDIQLRKKYALPPFGVVYTLKKTTLRNPLTPPEEPFAFDGTYTVCHTS